VFPLRIFYFGAEVTWGAGPLSGRLNSPVSPASGPQPLSLSSSSLAMHATYFSMVSVGGIVGASVPLWHVDLSVEVFTGFRAVSPNLEFDNATQAQQVAGGCWTSQRGRPVCPWIDTGETYAARLEPRVGLAYRLTPWVSARALVGFDALAHGAVHVATVLEIHTRSYDGFFPRLRP
jgi:hypothetical protein